MKDTHTSKGFTLIELLVVVAIIGILATVVLASLGSARSSAKDAKIKSALSAFRTQAELQYLEDGNYNSICDGGSTTGLIWREALTDGVNDRALCRDTQTPRYETFDRGETFSTYGGTTTLSGEDSNGSLWAVNVPLNNGNWFCVDSTGISKETSTTSISTSSAADKSCL